ncbi:NAD(P)-dependent oxidoreductase [Candidatus Minimicrobia naudis]|uniref:NAD(P)-dependent oxidoreductase n=1 Tax=Candidatus Minimicrobia naudis TaxID=2841263 RepID=A0A8F1MCA9_9BACT|nr:NAD(P)-dependent oxidoreductase [Candidatus Minimicrobia naudis]
MFEYAGYDRGRVQPISTEEYAASKPGFALRPLNSDMDLSKLRRQTGFLPSD